MSGFSYTITPDWSHSGVYWCESGSADFSNAVNITVQDKHHSIILVSPALPVTEGDPVTLSCRDKEQKLLSNVFFYHNNKLIHNDSREELKISAVSKSDEGFYKCEHSGKESPQSWMAVRDKPQPVLSVSPSWLSPGASVTLSCGGLEHPSAGWRFFWYKMVPAKSSSSYISKATVTLQPNWSQIFRGEKVTLRCEIHGGGGAQWTYEWRPTSRNSPTSSEYRITAADSGEYKCRGRTDVFTITKWGVLRLAVSG
ncbi:PREDICTED: high affinity immunoglobulin gamma Fc receptor I-like [Cyprinodon variegatus]|uniref:high affinity immunoglobulin gamma Fc receptor I-like n=1 Tax=Cyprinodon variegatus TaxID=28743 RepID=UPI0007425E49|nr:PREDICTED: high affinity immunoglobulin gamma Fc receptor I-like [Cyprinodon variegatus]